MKKNAGFTLVEMMVVVAIVGVLAIGLSVSLSSSGAKLRSATRTIYGDMQSLRMEAVKRNKVCVVIFNPGADTYRMFVDDGPAGNNWAWDSTDTLLGVGTMPARIDLVSTTIPFNTYGYSSNGMTDQAITPGTYDVILKDSGNKYMGVRFGALGSISTITSTDGGVTWN